MKRSLRVLLILVFVLVLGAGHPGCGGKTLCTDACNKANICLTELGLPIQDIYNNCILPCSVQNPAWKSCVLGCDTDAPCLEYAVCLLYCGYWQ